MDQNNGQNPQPNEDQWDQPVAYDQNGRPLYTHPTRAAKTQVVHIARSLDPANPDIPPEIQQRSEESHKNYPQLNLSPGEYIISAVRRHPIGLLQIWAVVLTLIAAMGGVIGAFLAGGQQAGSMNSQTLVIGGSAAFGFLAILVLLGGLVATYVYENNRFYLTNESVIQEIQTSLFSKHEQTVSLLNIEDASYRQSGILQTMLNYGTIRLSTEGDETTYRFAYVANPKKHIAVLNNAVEAFKNGRPVLND
ncbi:MAG TPA: PH domain-containing protein [Nevskiaceae bacterium]|nr:PH domain-containing protein [Nevskiaceae bacterium]